MIPISIPKLYEEDKMLAKKAIDDNFIANGEQIAQFEKEFAEFCNKKYQIWGYIFPRVYSPFLKWQYQYFYILLFWYNY